MELVNKVIRIEEKHQIQNQIKELFTKIKNFDNYTKVLNMKIDDLIPKKSASDDPFHPKFDKFKNDLKGQLKSLFVNKLDSIKKKSPQKSQIGTATQKNSLANENQEPSQIKTRSVSLDSND